MPGIKKKTGGKRTGATLPFANAISQLKKVHEPSIGLTNASVFLLNDLAEVLIKRLIETSGKLASYDGKATMKARHAATAAQLVFVGPLGKYVGDFSNKAVAKFEATKA